MTTDVRDSWTDRPWCVTVRVRKKSNRWAVNCVHSGVLYMPCYTHFIDVTCQHEMASLMNNWHVTDSHTRKKHVPLWWVENIFFFFFYFVAICWMQGWMRNEGLKAWIFFSPLQIKPYPNPMKIHTQTLRTGDLYQCHTITLVSFKMPNLLFLLCLCICLKACASLL